MEQKELDTILEKHALWASGSEGGQRANLRRADLRRADLQRACLREAYLQWADLREANLQWTDLQGAYLQWADLRGAYLDFSVWPLWCGTKGVKVDRRIYLQLLAHLCAVDVDDDECKAHQQASMDLARLSHRAHFLGLESEE